jgi:hypothetical protein
MADNFNKPVRVFKANPEKNAGIKYTDDSVTLTGDDFSNFLTVSDKGVGMGGKVNLQTMPDNIKIGGIGNFSSLFQLMIPSTMTSPQAAITPSNPVEMLADIMDMATSMMGLI